MCGRVIYLIVFASLSLCFCWAQEGFLSPSSIPSITPADRLNDYFHRTYSWQQMGSLAVDTAIDNFLPHPTWGRSMNGYSCRYVSSFGKRLVTNSAEFGASSLFQEDIRYRSSHLDGFVPRLKFAVTHAFTAYGPDNRVEPAYGRFAGIAAVAVIEPSWRPGGWSTSRFGHNASSRALDLLQASVLNEFSPDMKRFGLRVRKRVLKK